jgi:hypothetical protein
MPFEHPLHLFSLLRFTHRHVIRVLLCALRRRTAHDSFAGRRLHRAQSGQGQGAFTC